MNAAHFSGKLVELLGVSTGALCGWLSDVLPKLDQAWWFVIADVVAVLTDSVDPSGYLKDMRRRDPEFGLLFKGGG